MDPQAYNPWFTLLLSDALYQCAQCTTIILAIITLSSLVLPQCLRGSSVGNNSSEGFVGVLARAGSHTRSEVEYMHKGGQKSILTDF